MTQGGGVAPPPIFHYGLPSAMGNRSGISRMGTAYKQNALTSSRGRIGTGIASHNGPARPMTAVRAAGYSSAGARSLFIKRFF